MEKQTGEAANGSYGGVKKRYDYDDDKRNKDESKKSNPAKYYIHRVAAF